eukprot:scaffold19688_cov141-Isochrysis_galbana.AAC.5
MHMCASGAPACHRSAGGTFLRDSAKRRRSARRGERVVAHQRGADRRNSGWIGGRGGGEWPSGFPRGAEAAGSREAVGASVHPERNRQGEAGWQNRDGCTILTSYLHPSPSPVPPSMEAQYG